METSTKTAALERMLAYTIRTIDDDLGINVPQELGGTMSKALLPGLLRKVRLSTARDGSSFPIYSDTQRNFAKLYVHVAGYLKEANEENRSSAMFHTSLYSRTVFQAALWKCHLAANSRDAECTSSAYLIGVPLAHLCGKSILRSCEIGISQYTARKLGVKAGEVIQLRRFPETNTIPMIVVISSDVGDHTVGLPVGSLLNTRLKTKDVPSLLGGDCDGDKVLWLLLIREIHIFLEVFVMGKFIRRLFKRARLHGVGYACRRIRYTWRNRFVDDRIDMV